MNRPLTRTQRAIIFELAKSIVMDSPVDRGTFRGNWRISFSPAQQQLAPSLLSFMGESRRLDNTRLHRELRVQLRYPTVREGLVAQPQG